MCVRLEQALTGTAYYARICHQRCSTQELEQLQRAFFNKRPNLERLRGEQGGGGEGG